MVGCLVIFFLGDPGRVPSDEVVAPLEGVIVVSPGKPAELVLVRDGGLGQ